MPEFLSSSVAQAVGLPFGIALVAALLLRTAGNPWPGLALILGFLASVVVIRGTQLLPLSIDRKIVIGTAVAAIIGLLVSHYRLTGRLLTAGLAVAGGVIVTWAGWPALMESRLRGVPWLLILAGAYVIWLVAVMNRLRRDPPRVGSAVVAIGISTGVACLLSGSALYAQYGAALAASALAVLLIVMLWGDLKLEPVFAFPAAVLASMLGVGGLLAGRLPWIALPVLACVPLTSKIRFDESTPRLLQVVGWIGTGLVVGALANLVVWFVARSG